jgi:hypothetical protein
MRQYKLVKKVLIATLSMLTLYLAAFLIIDVKYAEDIKYIQGMILPVFCLIVAGLQILKIHFVRSPKFILIWVLSNSTSIFLSLMTSMFTTSIYVFSSERTSYGLISVISVLNAVMGAIISVIPILLFYLIRPCSSKKTIIQYVLYAYMFGLGLSTFIVLLIVESTGDMEKLPYLLACVFGFLYSLVIQVGLHTCEVRSLRDRE